jgi:hypothetical protein
MKGEPCGAGLLTEELEGPGRAVPRIAHHGMTREPGMATDLMLTTGQKVALYKGVMGTPAKNPETSFAWNSPTCALRVEAAPCVS